MGLQQRALQNTKIVTPVTIATDDEEVPEDMGAQEHEPNADIPAGQVRAAENVEEGAPRPRATATPSPIPAGQGGGQAA